MSSKRMRSKGPHSLARRRHGLLRHLFISGTHNGYRPLFLRIEAVAVQAAIILLLFFIALAAEKLVIKNPSPQIGAVVASVLVELANADRVEGGLPTLLVNETLVEAAQMKANDMAMREYFAHETPEGLEPWHWFQKAGYEFRHAGENLAVYFSDSAEVERAWMNSPLHRANILGEQFTEMGIGIAHGRYQGSETTFVVQMFGQPSGASATIVETSETPPADSEIVAGASAEAKPIGAIASPSRSTLWWMLSAPRTSLQYAYAGIAVLIVLSVIFLFLVELRQLHVPSLMRGVGLLAMIVLILYGSTLISGELLIL